MGNFVKFDGSRSTIGDSITIYGGHHWDESAHDELATVLDEVQPSVIAHESSPMAFALQQLFRPNTDTMRVLEYTVQRDTELALIDMDWDPIYEEYPQERIDEIISQAEQDVDFEDSRGPTTLAEARATNERINEIDNRFYNLFITQRDIYLSRRLAWLGERYNNILATIGFAHLESVAGITADILRGDDAGLSPQKPAMYDAGDLLDLTASKEEILQEAEREMALVRVSALKSQFDAIRDQYRNDIKEISELE